MGLYKGMACIVLPNGADCDCICPDCGWEGKLKACSPKIDELITCPKCGHWIEIKNGTKTRLV